MEDLPKLFINVILTLITASCPLRDPEGHKEDDQTSWLGN